MSGKIVPQKLSKGVDICGIDDYYYIVRSDLSCYMRSTNFNRGLDLEVFSLHPACRDGDHYVAHEYGFFYIIKGNHYRRVKNLTTDEDALLHTLHPNCRGGDYYLSAFEHFYIIYPSRNVYRKTKTLDNDENGIEHALHPNCKDGIYYFGTKHYYYFVKPHDKWGIQYKKSTDFCTDENSETFSFHPNVVNFLPGGLSVTKGPSFGAWLCIKTISNDSQSPVEWQKKISKMVGFEYEKMSSIEHNWKVSSAVTAETGGLTSVITKGTFSLTAEYGGCSVNTDKETWKKATTVEETITITLKPSDKIYVWTYQLGLGKEPVLHCRDMRILDTSQPPTDNPLPPAPK